MSIFIDIIYISFNGVVYYETLKATTRIKEYDASTFRY